MTDPAAAAPTPAPAPASAPCKLRCLDGGEAPPEIAVDIKRLERFPAGAKERLWEILGPSLSEPVPPSMEERVERFCRIHGLAATELGSVVKACRFLIREASSRDLNRGEFLEDVAVITDRHVEIGRILLAGFDAAKAQVRREMIAATLAEHGKLLEGVDWRAEVISSSSRSRQLKIPVAVLTLRYREGARSDRITLQLSPDAVRQLRDMCDEMLR